MAGQVDVSEVFNNLSEKISQLLYGRNKNNNALINKTLDELNSINYRYQLVTNTTKAVLLINHCCSIISTEDSELVGKCSELIVNLLTRQAVVVEGRTQTVAVQWCLAALHHEKSMLNVLFALDALLRSNTKHELIDQVVGSKALLGLIKSDISADIKLVTLQCLEACTISLIDAKNSVYDKYESQFQSCYDIFTNYLITYTKSDNLAGVKSLSTCLRGTQNIIEACGCLNNLGLILGVIKTYMLFDSKGIEFVSPSKLTATVLTLPEATPPREKKGGKMTKHRKQKTAPTVNKPRQDNWILPFCTPVTIPNESPAVSGLKTSDSDFSDTEGGALAKLAINSGRVRQAALALFQTTIKTSEKFVIFSYWTNFIPDNRQSAGKQNLLTCVLSDSSARVRMGALNVLLSLLTSSKFYLQQAEKSDNLSFTSFAVILGLTIQELHRSLNLALYEKTVLVLVQVLKCVAALVQATPYHKLEKGLIRKLVRNMRALVGHRDQTVQVAALIVLGCVLAIENGPPGEVLDALCSRSEPKSEPELSQSESEPDAEQGGGAWLLDRCLANLDVKNPAGAENSIAVKLESLQIVSVMSRNYFEPFLIPNLPIITKTLVQALGDKYENVRLHAGRCVDFIGQAMNRIYSPEGGHLSIDTCVAFWQVLLVELPSLMQAESPILRATGCDCFGSIGAFVFEQLSREKQIIAITLLFGCSRDDDNGVKGAAVRALAICVLHPSLRDDIGFVIDTAEAILRVLQDEMLTVRVKTSWALGNLSDALVANQSGTQSEEIPNSLILKLINACIRTSGDNDKIRMNSVRALGNFLHLVTNGNKAEFSDVVHRALDVLVCSAISGSNMKVRWNSCYAIGNCLRNEFIYDLRTSKEDWRGKVFGGLCDLVVNFKNFKVRINASVALASPAERDHFGGFYSLVFCSLCKALETAQNMDDFNEYKHRDGLVEQICLGLARLVVLAKRDDLTNLHFNAEFVKVQMKRVWERLVPEKSTSLFEAHSYLSQLNSGLNEDQRTILESLDLIFRLDY